MAYATIMSVVVLTVSEGHQFTLVSYYPRRNFSKAIIQFISENKDFKLKHILFIFLVRHSCIWKPVLLTSASAFIVQLTFMLQRKGQDCQKEQGNTEGYIFFCVCVLDLLFMPKATLNVVSWGNCKETGHAMLCKGGVLFWFCDALRSDMKDNTFLA